MLENGYTSNLNSWVCGIITQLFLDAKLGIPFEVLNGLPRKVIVIQMDIWLHDKTKERSIASKLRNVYLAAFPCV
jgi:hypothetical protein